MCLCAVTTYCEEMTPRVESLVVKKKEVSDEDMDRFGKKDPEAYPTLKCEL